MGHTILVETNSIKMIVGKITGKSVGTWPFEAFDNYFVTVGIDPNGLTPQDFGPGLIASKIEPNQTQSFGFLFVISH
jgi:hypothetical protein